MYGIGAAASFTQSSDPSFAAVPGSQAPMAESLQRGAGYGGED